MALTRKMLKAMGIEEEKIDQIIEAHAETVDSLKESREKFKEDAEKYAKAKKDLDSLEKELDVLKSGENWQEKYDSLKSEYDKYKESISEKESIAEKEKAVRAYFESKNITGKNLEIAMRGCKDEINSISVEDGKIKDSSALDTLISGDFSGLISKTNAVGVNTSTPPANAVSAGAKTREEIMKIKDTGERQKAWAEYLSEKNKE